MKIVYTIGWTKLPIRLHTANQCCVPIIRSENRETIDRLCSLIEKTFGGHAWSIINNTYTKDEIVFIALRWIILHAYAMPWHTYFYPHYYPDNLE